LRPPFSSLRDRAGRNRRRCRSVVSPLAQPDAGENRRGADEGLHVIEAAVTAHVETQQALTTGLSKAEFESLDRLLTT